MALKILKVPNPILYQKTAEIKKIDAEVLDLIAAMIQACRKAKGIGLAAPQVGKSVQLAVINLEHLGLSPFALINPKITKRSWRKIEMEEGCLSIPGVFGIVKRPKKITVKTQNVSGGIDEFDADDLLARVIQHELDHLQGILFTTKIIRRTDGTGKTGRRDLKE